MDDLTWTKGRHTVQFGGNTRVIANDRTNFNNLPNYSFSRNTLLGLGGDITANVLTLMQSALRLGRSGSPPAPTSPTRWARSTA